MNLPKIMARTTIVSLMTPLIFFLNLNVFADSSRNVRIYAKECFEKINIERKDIPRSMNCFDGDEIDVTAGGISLAKESCNSRDSCELPEKCDNPAWLNNACYGNSYLTTFKAKSDPNVTGALLCRHKTRNTDQPRRFDDIAMILHNNENGETCWFQTRDGSGVDLNGLRVPHPMRTGARLFWIKPSDVEGIKCIKCHDSGPFITSPWLNQAKSAGKLRDPKKSKYRNSTPPFNKWTKPVFVSVGRHGLTDTGDKSCTHCHHIGVERTWEKWIDYSVGDRDNDTKLPSNEKVFMPPRSLSVPLEGKYDKSEWEHHYREHVKALKECCKKFAGNPKYKGDDICKKE